MSATGYRGDTDTDDVIGHARGDLTVPGRSALRRLVSTRAETGVAIARLALGLVMLPHALLKVSTLFGGHGFAATFEAFTTQMHIPRPIALLVIVGELVCSVALISGALTRIAAAGVIAIMLGAIATVHLPHGFFMNWTSQQAGEGFEYHLLAIALGLVLVFMGGGRASIDRVLMRRRPMMGGSMPTTFTSG